jgi:hypothetical protein
VVFSHTNIVTATLDGVESFFLSITLFIVSPLRFLQSFSLGKAHRFIKVLTPQGLLSSFVRAMIDRQLGQADRAVAAFESIIGSLEDNMTEGKRLPRPLVFVLTELYAKLARIHLYYGHIDDAALAVIRASRSLGVERIKGVPDFDVRIAQIVRAGIAAGKLLEQGALTTFMLQQPVAKTGKPKFDAGLKSVDDEDRIPPPPIRKEAKVIPFPRPYLH